LTNERSAEQANCTNSTTNWKGATTHGQPASKATNQPIETRWPTPALMTSPFQMAIDAIELRLAAGTAPVCNKQT